MKVSELQGVALDWAVAKALGGQEAAGSFLDGVVPHPDYFKFYPSTNWAQGGPIIERERLALFIEYPDDWGATDGNRRMPGDTPLIAAMRCYVASKLGDDIELPEELK